MRKSYEKFKSLPKAHKYLKEGVSFQKLDDIATKMSDNEAADLLQKQRKILFKQIDEGYEASA